MRISLLLILSLWATVVLAQESTVICPGDKRLIQIEGYYAHSTVLKALPKVRIWSQAFSAAVADSSGFRISKLNVHRNWGWHEGDPGGSCIRVEGTFYWLLPRNERERLAGPFVRLGGLDEDEGGAYLSKFMTGCFTSQANERWCLSPDAITFEKKHHKIKLQKDTSEAPTYGTALRVEGSTSMFWVFVPIANGWMVFRDEWVTTEGREEVDPSRPWQVLKK